MVVLLLLACIHSRALEAEQDVSDRALEAAEGDSAAICHTRCLRIFPTLSKSMILSRLVRPASAPLI